MLRVSRMSCSSLPCDTGPARAAGTDATTGCRFGGRLAQLAMSNRSGRQPPQRTGFLAEMSPTVACARASPASRPASPSHAYRSRVADPAGRAPRRTDLLDTEETSPGARSRMSNRSRCLGQCDHSRPSSVRNPRQHRVFRVGVRLVRQYTRVTTRSSTRAKIDRSMCGACIRPHGRHPPGARQDRPARRIGGHRPNPRKSTSDPGSSDARTPGRSACQLSTARPARSPAPSSTGRAARSAAVPPRPHTARPATAARARRTAHVCDG